MSSQQQASTTPVTERDEWSTPDFVFVWAKKRWPFKMDVAAILRNAKCPLYLAEEWPLNGLTTHWALMFTSEQPWFWCNPPYSNIEPWLEKAYQESQKGVGVVMLVPTPNGEQSYRDHVFGKAAEIIFINGRLSFIKPDGTAKGGNTRGSCFIVYRPYHIGQTALSWVDREDMREEYAGLNSV